MSTFSKTVTKWYVNCDWIDCTLEVEVRNEVIFNEDLPHDWVQDWVNTPRNSLNYKDHQLHCCSLEHLEKATALWHLRYD